MSARGAATRVLVLVLALSVSVGCSGDDRDDGGDGAGAPGQGPSHAKTAAPVRTRTTLERVPGKLGRDVRKRVTTQVGEVVDRWFDAAFIGGDYPRRDFRDAFLGFTAGAAAQARRDKALMTNAPLGRRVDDVRATQRRVWVDVLPAGGRAAAATARFRLGFTTSGDVHRDVVVRGRLMLTPGPHGWKVFGYDVAKGSPAELAPPSPERHAKKHGDKGGKR